jgi:hypothetical protein
MPTFKRLPPVVLCSLLLLGSAAAVSAGVPGTREGARSLASLAPEVLEAPDLAALIADEAAKDAGSGRPHRFAAPIAVGFTPENSGRWERLRDGSWLWRLRLRSAAALSLNLAFTRFSLPRGARLWVHDPAFETVHGPYTRADRSRRGRLFTPIVPGQEAVVTLQLPANAGRRAGLELGTVNHGFRPFGRGLGKQGSCNIDVVCPDGDLWRDQIRSVAVYTLEGVWDCSGNLVNNTAQDLKPFLLTAYHCGVTTGNDDSVVTYWNYQSTRCGDLGGGSLSQTISGSTLRSTWRDGDFALLELKNKPPEAYDVYYVGWDATGSRPQSTVVVHHPNAEEKAIAFDDDPPGDSNNILVGNSAQTHWRVHNYEKGITEPGSSGACLFDEASKLCVGWLTGGEASCSRPDLYDVYGKLAVSWNGGGAPASRLRDWLDPVGTGANRVLAGRNATTVVGPCVPDATTMCLLSGRYEAKVTWRNPFNNDSGIGGAAPFTDFSGFFWFTDPANLELMLKVLELDGVIKVFYGQLTDLEFQLTLREVATGLTKVYSNGPANCGAIDQDFRGLQAALIATDKAVPPATTRCRPDADTLCLLSRRFRVEVDWRNQFNGDSGRGQQNALSDLSGLFSYTDPRNVELLVKVLDFGDRILFIWGALSDLEYTIRVTDTATEAIKVYNNPAGQFCGGLDNDFASGQAVAEVEPNDSPEQAQVLSGTSPLSVRGNLETADVGTIEINFQSGAREDVEDLYRITTTAAGLSVELNGLAADADLYLINADLDEVLGQSIEAGVVNERIDLPTLPPGTYYLGVSIYDPEPIADTTPYTLKLTGAF